MAIVNGEWHHNVVTKATLTVCLDSSKVQEFLRKKSRKKRRTVEIIEDATIRLLLLRLNLELDSKQSIEAKKVSRINLFTRPFLQFIVPIEYSFSSDISECQMVAVLCIFFAFSHKVCLCLHQQ